MGENYEDESEGGKMMEMRRRRMKENGESEKS